MRVEVGIVDSGVAPDQCRGLSASVGIVPAHAGARRVAATADAVGHGTAVAGIILAEAPLARLASAQAFMGGRRADAACVAEAIAWCLERQVRVINLSLGLRHDDQALQRACGIAVASGAIVIAAAAARGPQTYPAAYPGVIAVSGDARCALRTWSVLEPRRLYGTATQGPHGTSLGGASYAAARMSANAARFLSASPQAKAEDFLGWLEAAAAFCGCERRATEAADAAA